MEVDKQGATQSHVFRGTVTVKPRPASVGSQKDGGAVVVRENESVRVELPIAEAAERRPVVLRTVAEPARFVRNMPPAKHRLPMVVLAYFRLGEDDPGAAAGKPVGKETMTAPGRGPWRGLARPGTRPTPPCRAARWPSASRGRTTSASTATTFTNRPWTTSFSKPRIRPNRIARWPTYLVHNGDVVENGYGLLLAEDGWVLHIPWADNKHLGIPYKVGQWVHVGWCAIGETCNSGWTAGWPRTGWNAGPAASRRPFHHRRRAGGRSAGPKGCAYLRRPDRRGAAVGVPRAVQARDAAVAWGSEDHGRRRQHPQSDERRVRADELTREGGRSAAAATAAR